MPFYERSGGSASYVGVRNRCDEHGNSLSFILPDEQLLMRFLILGTQSGSFYTTEVELKEEYATCVTRLINSGQGEFVVEKILEVAKSGRASRINSILMSLAMCCRSSDMKTKSAAYRAIVEVCNIPTHLFKLITYLEGLGETTGWGRGLRLAVSRWYNQFSSNPQRLAMLVTKYRERERWSHRDLMRLAHLKPADDVLGFVLRYAVKDLDQVKEYYLRDETLGSDNNQLREIVAYLDAVEEVRHLQLPAAAVEVSNDNEAAAKNKGQANMEEDRTAKGDGAKAEVTSAEEEEVKAVVARAAALIRQFDLLREHLPSPLLDKAVVWEALLDKMPMMAMMRNLNKLTSLGVLDVPANLAKVVDRFNNREAVRGAKIHPYAILVALHTYTSGHGVKGHMKWVHKAEVAEALEKAFYLAFENVEPTNKRILMAVDISGSMSFMPPETVVSPKMAATAMMMVTRAVENVADVVVFSTVLTPVELNKDWSLQDTMKYVEENFPMGATDCTQPMIWAKDNKKEYDAFIIYTDNETWFSTMPPHHALQQYRDSSGISNARLVTVGMSSDCFSVADPNDLHMMDIVGFDPQTPAVINRFLCGSFMEEG